MKLYENGEQHMYDCIIIGGGPSGLMASIAAAEQGAKVLLIDKGNKLGKKLAISGGGRCNVTNRLPINEIVRHIPGNGRFLYGAFSIFNNEDIIRFFENLGVPLKEEDHGRMFPVSNSAQSVVNALLKRMDELGVEIRLNEAVQDVLYENNHVAGVVLKNGETLFAIRLLSPLAENPSLKPGPPGMVILGRKKQDIRLPNYFQLKFLLLRMKSLFGKKFYKDYHFGMFPLVC